MAAGNWIVYDTFREYMADGTIDLDAGDAYFTCCLTTSSYTPSASHSTYSDFSANEVSQANGYTTGGDIASGTSWTHSGTTATWDWTTDPQWTASGGSITCRNAVIVHIAAGSGLPQSTDKLIAYCVLDSTDVTATDGNTLTIQLNASGIFTLSGAAS